MNASEAVTALLEKSGLTKAELSRRSGVSRALIDDYIKGRRQPSFAQLERLGGAASLRADLVWVDPTPFWARPNPAMNATPLTIEERAQVMERVVDLAMAMRRRERGDLEFPAVPNVGAGMNTDGVVYQRALDVHQRLLAVGIGNEIGGALALAYYVDDPRGTQDVDLNVALPRSDAEAALRVLPADVPWDESVIAKIARDGQVRIMWPIPGEFPMPLDLFFAEHELHASAHERSVEVPFAGATARILSSTDLTIFKALFDRPKDWIDIQTMLDAHDSSVDLAEAARWVADIVGTTDPRHQRLLNLQD